MEEGMPETRLPSFAKESYKLFSKRAPKSTFFYEHDLRLSPRHQDALYVVAAIRRLLKLPGLFCERALLYLQHILHLSPRHRDTLSRVAAILRPKLQGLFCKRTLFFCFKDISHC